MSTALDHRAGPELLLGVLERALEEHRFIAEPLEEVSSLSSRLIGWMSGPSRFASRV